MVADNPPFSKAFSIATLFTPEKTPVTLTIGPKADTMKIEVPELGLWGLEVIINRLGNSEEEKGESPNKEMINVWLPRKNLTRTPVPKENSYRRTG
jgi:hypothetical protein